MRIQPLAGPSQRSFLTLYPTAMYCKVCSKVTVDSFTCILTLVRAPAWTYLDRGLTTFMRRIMTSRDAAATTRVTLLQKTSLFRSLFLALDQTIIPLSTSGDYGLRSSDIVARVSREVCEECQICVGDRRMLREEPSYVATHESCRDCRGVVVNFGRRHPLTGHQTKQGTVPALTRNKRKSGTRHRPTGNKH